MVLTDSVETMQSTVHKKAALFCSRSEKELRMDFNFFCCMYFLELFYLFGDSTPNCILPAGGSFLSAQHWKFICADVRFWKASIYPLSSRISFFLCIREVRCFFLQLHFECWFGEESCSSLPSTLLQYYDTRWQCTSLDAIARTKTLKVTNKNVKTAQTGLREHLAYYSLFLNSCNCRHENITNRSIDRVFVSLSFIKETPE